MKSVLRAAAAQAMRTWPPYSRLFVVGDGAGWSIEHDARMLVELAGRARVRMAPRRLLAVARSQSVFYASQFELLRRDRDPTENRVGTAYFHGRPGTPGMPEFDECYAVLHRRHEQIDRVQVSHREMEEIALSTGIDPAKVFRIPIGVDLRLFPPRDGESRRAARKALGIPQSAFVVGSLQKDGVGFGEGLEPKLVKGPDVLVSALEAAKPLVPELFVVLSGPARGYVRRRLEAVGIPYTNVICERYDEVPRLYEALDVVLIASRQEGGPKALLEGMASGVPVVTTRVGQAADLVVDGGNALMVDVDDADGLADGIVRVATGSLDLRKLLACGRATAEANAYEAQLPLWEAFFDGFVAHG